MRLETAGKFFTIETEARKHNAYLMSIQSYYIFVNFKSIKDAWSFIDNLGLLGLSVNTHRGEGTPMHVPAEVAICITDVIEDRTFQ